MSAWLNYYFLLEAMEIAGSIAGDRIEHGGVVPDYCLPRIADLGLSIVTQPGFLADRGDRFLAQLDAAEHADLYPFQRLLDAGIKVCASSDAPYGPVNPWVVISAAHKRETASGVVINAAECVSPARALQGYLAAVDNPGGDARPLEVGSMADLCLLKQSCMATLASSESQPVAHTLFNGELVYSA